MYMMNRSKITRIEYIDFLKFIGLTGIILAHVGPPNWLFALRNFDVPLMVIVSSMLAEKSYIKYKDTHNGFVTYWRKRFKRLVIPTWIFLAFYFVFELLCGILHEPYYYLTSFALTRYGIGYVWIILIYLYSAILIPCIDKIQNKSTALYLIICSYILYEFACFKELNTNKIIDSTIFYIIPYGILTYLGYCYTSMSSKKKLNIIIVTFISFIICGIFYWYVNGEPTTVQIAKYPPRLYYLSYGIACSCVLLYIFERFDFKIHKNCLIKFISTNSLWIYLWHIFVLKIIDLSNICNQWLAKFMITYFGSIFIVYIINLWRDRNYEMY